MLGQLLQPHSTLAEKSPDSHKKARKKARTATFGALGPVNLLKAFAKSIGRKFIKGHALGDRLCPSRA